ncbi:K(lysine) acetyltransferase [Coemansia erecta]|uniref:histone acetyltransferase n=1 Tax=Coemansia erecta TaxID=147472 RepID=A0A9W8CTL6_9FUNG|nr:K(lysine) acetyltransferase [Coemansia erecta]
MGQQPQTSSDAESKQEDEVSAQTPTQTEVPSTQTEFQKIIIGKYSIAAWYASPYPSEFKQGPDLYICERCLKYMRYRRSLDEHQCEDAFPRGQPVYEDMSTVLYEVDGKEHMLYCQNLCLLSKLFLDQKTIYYDIGGFLFYILLVKSFEDGRLKYSFAGYFSKEKVSVERNNLACILVLPPFRGQNYGQLLIELSYELTKLEKTTGGPEQPLSSQGFHSYRSYWRRALLRALLGELPSAARYLQKTAHVMRKHTHDWEQGQRIFSLERLSEITGMRIEDVLFTMDDLGLLQTWSGRHVVCIADEDIRKIVAERRIKLGLRIDYDGLLVAYETEPESESDSDDESSQSADSDASADESNNESDDN